MTTHTRITMTRVAMRAAIWSYIRSVWPDTMPDSEIDRLTHKAVAAVFDVAEQNEQEQKEQATV